MTDHPTPGPTTSSHASSQDPVIQACVHIDAAAGQLEAAANGDVFSALLTLAGQLALIRGGIPTIRAAVDPNDHLTPTAHVHWALALLDAVRPSAGPPDLLVWTVRLADLHDALLAAEQGQP
jgi:hypothetical protein